MEFQEPWEAYQAPAPQGQPQPLIARAPPPQTPTQSAREALALTREQREADTEEGVEVPGDVSLEGDAYLQSLPASLRTQVRALSEGRIAMPQGRAATSPYWQRIMQATGHYDPSFDSANYATRVATRRNFTSGVARRNITSLNTVLGHMDSLRQRGEALNNTDWPAINTVRNFVRRQSGDDRVDRFNLARQAVVDEMERAFRGSAGSVTGIEHWRESLNAAQSPEQLEGTIREGVELLRSRIDALGDEYNAGMGRSDDPVTLLNPHSREILESLGGGSSAPGAGAPPPTLGGPTGAEPGVTTGPDGLNRTNATVGNANAQGAPSTTDGSLFHEADDPTLAGVNRRLGEMVASGAPDDEIREYARSVGLPGGTAAPWQPGHSLEDILRYRRTPAFREWRRQNPRTPYQVNIDDTMIPNSAGQNITAAALDTSVGAAALRVGDTVLGNRTPEIVEALGGQDADLSRAGMDEVRRRHPVASIAGDIGGGALLYAGGAAAMERVGATAIGSRLPAWATARSGSTFAPRSIMGDVAIGAYEGSGMDPEDPLGGALRGAAIAAPAGTVGRGAINTTARAASPTGGRLAEAYSEGVQPTIGQRAGAATGPISGPVGRTVNRLEQIFQDIPVVGEVQRGARGQALDQWERGAFNRALRFLPGPRGRDIALPGKMELGTEPHRYSQEAFRRAYDRVHRRLRVDIDDGLNDDLANVMSEAGRLPEASRARFETILRDSLGRRLSQGGGTLAGDDLQSVMSEVGRTVSGIRSSAVGDRELADVLDDLAMAVRENARRHSSPDAIRTLDNIDTGYAHLVRIENAARTAGGQDQGRFTPRSLLNAEKRAGGLRSRAFLRGNGLLDSYADSGLRLSPTVPNSGTPERALVTTGAHLLGAKLLSPIVAAPWAASTLATAPGIRQTINAALAPNRPALSGFRKQLEDRAYLGSMLGVPGAVEAYGGK